MKKKFIKFLKDNDALIPFCCNLAIDNITLHYQVYDNKGISLTQLFNAESLDPSRWINVFWWVATTEGQKYWSNLNTKWCNMLNQ